ncbi:MAG TPA: hypothetical protein VMZ26_17835 [Pyrinomonadaceae bacterium]|nr:hypothetical protein [Pyrinomonadaceae bacterium]
MKVVTILLISLFACNPGTPSAQELMPPGLWGGKGIELTVKADGARIDYGCDSGTIDEKLQPDSNGRFSARGTHVFGMGGPRTPEAPAAKPHQARYEGVRKGDKLELTVLLPELNRNLGKFILRLGDRSALDRCG